MHFFSRLLSKSKLAKINDFFLCCQLKLWCASAACNGGIQKMRCRKMIGSQKSMAQWQSCGVRVAVTPDGPGTDARNNTKTRAKGASKMVFLKTKDHIMLPASLFARLSVCILPACCVQIQYLSLKLIALHIELRVRARWLHTKRKSKLSK